MGVDVLTRRQMTVDLPDVQALSGITICMRVTVEVARKEATLSPEAVKVWDVMLKK